MPNVAGSEEWRPISEDSRYEVSNLGRVRSWCDNRGGRAVTARVLAYRYDSKGYRRISLGGRRDRYVHHLVLLAFVGPRPAGWDGRHLDGDKLNNARENLEWSTHAINMRDQYSHGTRARGATHGMVKLTETQIVEIRAAPGKYRDIGALYGICAGAVCNIKLRKSWSHLP